MNVIKKKEQRLEEILKRERKSRKWSFIDVAIRLNNPRVTPYDVKNWEKGKYYPDVDIIYDISALYRIPSSQLTKARYNSYARGLKSIHVNFINFICYMLGILIKGITATGICLYVATFIISVNFFINSMKI